LNGNIGSKIFLGFGRKFAVIEAHFYVYRRILHTAKYGIDSAKKTCHATVPLREWPCTTACPVCWAMGDTYSEIVYSEGKNIFRIIISHTCTTSPTNQPIVFLSFKYPRSFKKKEIYRVIVNEGKIYPLTPLMIPLSFHGQLLLIPC